jgi:hypothetical protein
MPASESDAGPGSTEAGQPKVLILTALRWLPVVRLAFELAEAGFTIEAVCPRGYALEKASFVRAAYRYSPTGRIGSLRGAILASRPEFLIPCDDCVASQLHELYQVTDPGAPDGPWLRSLIARSLGRPEHFSTLYSRYAVASLARELEVPGPATEAVMDERTLISRLSLLGLPAVLKSDGSWGGRGVVVAADREHAVRAFHKLSAPPAILRTLKRLVVDRDATLVRSCVRRRRPAVSVQRFVRGRPANAAVACWQGKVLAAVFVEVLCSNGATGPATVVRVVSHPGMAMAVERVVARLKLSGLCGLDFVLSEDGCAHFIELNPRATPTCHLIAADGKDLLAEVRGALRNVAASNPRGAPCREPLALFPQEMMRDPGSPYLKSAFHDVPWKFPELVKLALTLRDRRSKSWMRRLRPLAMAGRPSAHPHVTRAFAWCLALVERYFG